MENILHIGEKTQADSIGSCCFCNRGNALVREISGSTETKVRFCILCIGEFKAQLKAKS